MQERPALPRYLPPDTVQLTSWQDIHEALRSSNLENEKQMAEVILGGTLGQLHGEAHVLRRRRMNALVRPLALHRYQAAAALAIRRLMAEELHPDADGRAKCDLVPLMYRTFVHVAAEVIGLEGVDTPSGRDDLSRLYEVLAHAPHLKYMETQEERDLATAAAVAAKQEYIEEFFRPSYEKARRQRRQEATTLLELIAEGGDAAWEEVEQGVRETIGVMIGSIRSSSQLAVNVVGDLSAWFGVHPEDACLAGDREFLYRAMHEAIRIHTPTPIIGRVARADVELSSGVRINAGQAVAIYHSLASRDPSVFGPDANEFNPRREVPNGVPRYGATFGSGPHMCIGMRIVVGTSAEEATHIEVIRNLMEAGVGPDPGAAPPLRDTEVGNFVTYPVVFSRPTGVPA
jgi:cytochrome P450